MSDSRKPTDTVSDAEPTCPEPSAANPWRVELCWTPDQNSSHVSVYPSRAPLYAVWGLLNSGETLLAVAGEHGLTEEQVRVLDLLRREVAVDPRAYGIHADPPGSGSQTGGGAE